MSSGWLRKLPSQCHTLSAQIANQLHGTSRRSGGMMWPGTDVTFHNGRAHRVLAYDPRVNFTTRVDTVISWFLDSAEPVNCVLLYHEEPDATGHRFGPFSTEVRTQVEVVDNLVGQMVQSLAAAGLLDRSVCGLRDAVVFYGSKREICSFSALCEVTVIAVIARSNAHFYTYPVFINSIKHNSLMAAEGQRKGSTLHIRVNVPACE